MQKQSDQNGKLKLLRILWFFRNKKLFLAVLKTGLRNKYWNTKHSIYLPIYCLQGKGQNYENQNVENQKELRKPC